jgi:hypothetical protein
MLTTAEPAALRTWMMKEHLLMVLLSGPLNTTTTS